jgi:heavy metal sensor kinase
MNTRSIRFRLTVWYAGLLAGMLILFSLSVYLGLSHYLERTLKETLSQQAKQIGESWLGDVGVSGESYVAGEINEHISPKVNDRFIRITRADGGVMYLSDAPESEKFDPSRVPPLKAQAGQESLREERLSADSELMIFALPFRANNGGGYMIEVGASNQEIERALHGLLLAIVIGLPVVVAVAIAGGYLLMRRALRPVDEITQSAERISSRNLSERLPVAETGDEIERLSVGLNRMIARLDESFQHINRFSADASHELRTPLTILRGELEATVQQPQIAPELRETLGSALEETERLSRIVESLMAIARLDAGEARIERAHFDLAELASGATEQMRLLAEDKNISLRCAAKQRVRIEGDRSRLKQVIVNLVDNAIKYTNAGGHVGVKVYASDGWCVLEVNDDGVGIPAEAAPHIFERFYRADKARSRQMGGAGLGLSIIKAIVTAHGGLVRVESVEGRGSRFLVELPIGGEESE